MSSNDQSVKAVKFNIDGIRATNVRWYEKLAALPKMNEAETKLRDIINDAGLGCRTQAVGNVVALTIEHITGKKPVFLGLEGSEREQPTYPVGAIVVCTRTHDSCRGGYGYQEGTAYLLIGSGQDAHQVDSPYGYGIPLVPDGVTGKDYINNNNTRPATAEEVEDYLSKVILENFLESIKMSFGKLGPGELLRYFPALFLPVQKEANEG